MVIICDGPFIESLNIPEYPFELSDFQKHAIKGILDGNHVLITAHTGSGKTLPAEFAIQHFTQTVGKRVIYTSPIKALSNQKYYEFTQKYPDITFGLMTGDIKTNPEAQVLIMTTEILMNALFINNGNGSNGSNPLSFTMDIATELGCVIFDEIHYINDEERGQVWEKTILMLPEHIQMVMLSATIDSPHKFAEWCENRYPNTNTNKSVVLASTNHRIVPLTHYGFLTTNESYITAIKDKTLAKELRDSTNKLILLQGPDGKFNDMGQIEIAKTVKLFSTRQLFHKRHAILNNLMRHLRDRDMLPAIAFVFSRKQVEQCAKEIQIPLLEDDSKVGYIVARECEQIIRKLPNFQEYMNLPEYRELVALLEKGIAIHHSGMIPILREIVEIMISKKYIKLLFATESFAIGLDCPIKTAVFLSLTKFDGIRDRPLLAHEYTQMAGRAGRRGLDTIGHVVHCNNLFPPPSIVEYKSVLCGVPQVLKSKFRISYSLILSIAKSNSLAAVSKDKAVDFIKKSMITKELNLQIGLQEKVLKDLCEKIEKKGLAILGMRTPEPSIREYLGIMETISKLVNKKKKEATTKISQLTDSYRYIKEDAELYQEYRDLLRVRDIETGHLDYLGDFVETQVSKIFDVLKNKGFIQQFQNETDSTDSTDLGESFEWTNLGKMAAMIAEVHPLIMASCFKEWDNFRAFSPRQMVGFLSTFCDIKVPDDQMDSRPMSDDMGLNRYIEDCAKMYADYDTLELKMDIHTGIHYQGALKYNLIDLAMEWTDVTTETEAKEFIQNRVNTNSISTGDFTKAMMKIAVITKELSAVAELIGAIDTLHMLSKIDGLILKYITTAQSLYL